MRAVLSVLCLVVVWAFSVAPVYARVPGPLRIGALTEGFGPTPWIVGLRNGLTALGYRERTDFVIGLRFTRGDPDALTLAARQFVEQNVDLLVVGGGPPVRAALAATAQIPIVFVGGGDPVALGFVTSYSRPGGNITGVATRDLELAPKRLEMLRGIAPVVKKVLFGYDVADPSTARELKGYRDAAPRLGLVLVERPAQTREEAQKALGALRRGEVHGILGPGAMSLNIPGLVLETGARLGLPTMFSDPFYVEQGALGSYSTDLQASGRQAARLVDKILRGTPPGDIPVEIDNHIHFALNLKAARALGLVIPPDTIRRADRVLE